MEDKVIRPAVRAVIFDLDGLLINSEVYTLAFYQKLTAPYGSPVTRDFFIAHLSGHTADSNAALLIGRYHMPLTVQDVLSLQEANDAQNLITGIPLKKGARELLAYLRSRQIRILLATSSWRSRAEKFLEKNGVLDYFDDMVCSEDFENSKPAPDVFLAAQAKSGEARENCLVLEDSEAGVQAAHNAGIRVICVPDMKKPTPETAALAYAVLPDLNAAAVLI